MKFDADALSDVQVEDRRLRSHIEGMFKDGTDTIACPVCGAVHEVDWRDFPERDSGTLRCKACGGILKNWKGTRDYHTARLVEDQNG